MDYDAFIASVKEASPEECGRLLIKFNHEYDKARVIPGMSAGMKETLWRAIFQRLDDVNKNAEIVNDLLNSLRILSRDKDVLENTMTEEMVTCLLKRSGLDSAEGPIGTAHLCGMKVIFNVLFQSEKLQQTFISKGLLKCLVHLFRSPSIQNVPMENILFLLKIFFIITALQKTCGSTVRNDLNGLEAILDYTDSVTSEDENAYDDMTADVISELLKLVYNLIHDIQPKDVGPGKEPGSKDFTLLCKVTRIVKRCLLHDVQCQEKRLNVQVHAVHLLCAVPPETFDELIVDDESHCNHTRVLHESSDLAAIEAIVNLLDSKLDAVDKSPAEPILVALCKMASVNRVIRHYLKRRILPPLTAQDLMQRPEVGNSIRNKICRLIHTPTGSATKTAATLVFILCKESVGRMIKYTGYGNAAGLLADQGLLMGGRGTGQYSDDSESDTEEYEELRDKINAVEGWMKPEEPPLEMTEEQKEYEALKLVQHIHELTANKTIQPCRIGPDGKPQPIEHVLELQEGLDHVIKTAVGKGTASDSDSD